MKVEVAILGSPSLIVHKFSMDVKQHLNINFSGGHPGRPVPNKPDGFCGRKATLKQNCTESELDQELCEYRGGHPGLPVPNKPDGFCGRQATLKQNCTELELRSCVKVEVAILGSPSLIVHKFSMDVKQHLT